MIVVLLQVGFDTPAEVGYDNAEGILSCVLQQILESWCRFLSADKPLLIKRSDERGSGIAMCPTPVSYTHLTLPTTPYV